MRHGIWSASVRTGVKDVGTRTGQEGWLCKLKCPNPYRRSVDTPVQAMVQALREQLPKDQKKGPGELPVWPGTVIGSLTREEISDDVA